MKKLGLLLLLVTFASFNSYALRIYGLYMGDVHYELQSTIIETLYAEPEYKKDKKHEYTTYPGELYLYSEGREGYKVNVYRTNTVNQQSEWLYTDTYEAKKAVYYEGV